MGRIYKKISLIVLLFLAPVLAFANEATQVINTNKEVFNLVASDPTKAFLAQLFGNVGHVLHGTSGQLLGQLFLVFNRGILVVAGIFFIWTIFVTVSTSAHEGKFMGPKQSKPAFAVMRTVLGFGALVPMPSGYSMIQVFVMWIVLHGVGFANNAWNRALDYFSTGGVLMVTTTTADASEQIDLAANVLQAQVCMFYHEKRARAGGLDATGKYIDEFTPQYGEKSVRFPARAGQKDDAGCGKFSWDAEDKLKNSYLKTAMQQLVYDTRPVAKEIVDPRGNINNLPSRIEDVVEDGAADWISYTLPVRGKPRDGQKEYFELAKQRGWIFAGMYYYGLSSLQREFSDDDKWLFWPSHKINGLNMGGGSASGVIKFPNVVGQFDAALDNEAKVGDLKELGHHYIVVADAVAKAKQAAEKLELTSKGQGNDEDMPTDNAVMNYMLKSVLAGVNMANKAIMQNDATKTDPILQLQVAGNEMMKTITHVWIGGSVAIMASSVVLSLWSSASSLGYAFRDMINFFTPLLMLLLVTLYVQGLTMAYYIPMVPFIVFTFAVMGWFVVVIESMIAAPLVALGLTHVEGHDMWGRSEEAMWLLLNVFLRPILMIFGLVSGMILSRIGLVLLNMGFGQLMSEFSKINDMYVSVGRFMIYIALAIMIVNASYSLIHKVPDRVMRWLRSGGDQMSEYVNQATQGAQRGVQESGQQYGRMGSEALGGGRWTHAVHSLGQQRAESSKAKMTPQQHKQQRQDDH